MLLASSEWRPEMLLKSYSAQDSPPQQKTCWAPNVNNAKVEKQWFQQREKHAFDSTLGGAHSRKNCRTGVWEGQINWESNL